MRFFHFKTYLIPLVLILFVNCSRKSNHISLKQWSNDEKLYSNLYNNYVDNCDSVINTHKQIKTVEFKNKLNGQLSNCYMDHPEILKKYIKKDVETGLHPKRIDSIKYASVFKDIKSELNSLHRDFWKDRDTTFFLELERRTTLDQELAIKYRKTLDTTYNVKRVGVFKENTQYLLDFCRENGYPRVPEQQNFDHFRFNLNASTIVFHADYQSKVELLEYAIDAAKKGKISWNDPIAICITFHTNAMKHRKSRPLFFLNYKDNNQLNIEDSYLQLYSIKKHYSDDMKRRIVLQPSKFNKKAKSIIQKQLTELKNILVNEFSYPRDHVEISFENNPDEIDYRYVTPYLYTVSSLKK